MAKPDRSASLREIVDAMPAPGSASNPGVAPDLVNPSVANATPLVEPAPVSDESPADAGGTSTPIALRDAAQAIVEWLGSLDPTWDERMRIMAEERGLTPEQVIGTLAAYPLEHSLHMAVNSHPAFEPDGAFSTPRNGPCPECGKVWSKAYPGQPVCSNECATTYYEKKRSAA